MSAVVHLSDARQKRNGTEIDDTLQLATADVADAVPGQAETFYSRDPNGCVSVWFDERDSLVRQCWGASQARFAFFTETVEILGLVMKRSGQDWLRFGIDGVPNDLAHCESAEKTLAAFQQLFLDPRRVAQGAASSDPPRAPAGIPAGVQVAMNEASSKPASMPEFLETSPLNSFPTLLSDEQIDARARPREKMKVEPADFLLDLKKSYPKIAETIASTWGNPECEDFMIELLFGKRRKGQYFSDEASSALLELYERHAREFVFRSALDESGANENRTGPTEDVDRTQKLMTSARAFARN